MRCWARLVSAKSSSQRATEQQAGLPGKRTSNETQNRPNQRANSKSLPKNVVVQHYSRPSEPNTAEPS